MLKTLKALAKREASGALSGKQLTVGNRVVRVERLLGEGGFATIYRCTDVDTGETFALKHFILTGYPEAERDADKEVTVMELLAGCPYVVRLHEASLGGPPGGHAAAYALMDFCPDTLVGWLQQRSYQLDDGELLRVALPVARAVQAMHSLSPPLAHRDLKAENVLLSPAGHWVLCDFGSCSSRHGVLESARDIALEEEVVRKYTTPAYRAPELYDLYAREYIGPPVDIWALGVLLYLLAFGRLPFEGEAKLQVLNGRYTMPEGRPTALRALIRDMLRVSPHERPTVHEVVARLAGLAPPEVWEEFPDMHSMQMEQQQLEWQGKRQHPPGTAATATGTATSSQPSPAHDRVPSHGWADFAAEASPQPAAATAVSAAHARRESGSGSWATFSPTKGGDAEGGLLTTAPAASAGSFWSSFGEEVPSQPQEPAQAQQQQQQQQQPLKQQQTPPGAQPLLHKPGPSVTPPQHPRRQPMPAQAQVPSQQAQAATHQPAKAASAAAAATPPCAKAALQPPPLLQPAAETSPLSAGLSRMSRVSHVGGPPSVAKPAAPAVVQPSASSAPAPGLAHAGVGADGADAEALRQHSAALEELLQSRSRELRRLQQVVEQQATEIAQLRQQLQAAQQALQRQQLPQQKQHTNGGLAAAGGTSSAGTKGAAASSSTPSGSTPSSSRLGQDLRLQVPGSESAASTPATVEGGGSWVSFTTVGGGGRDAPTPTLLQPTGGSAFREGSSAQLSTSSSEAYAPAGAGPAAAGANVPPLEEALRSKLDLSLQSSSGALSRASSIEQPRHLPMRGNSSAALLSGAANGSTQQAQAPGGLRSFPVALTPGASPLGGGPRSAPPSLKPSPVRGAGIGMVAVGALGGKHSPTQPGSPLASRPSGGGTAVLALKGGSPVKHRRNMTAPDNNFFEDLDPLH